MSDSFSAWHLFYRKAHRPNPFHVYKHRILLPLAVVPRTLFFWNKDGVPEGRQILTANLTNRPCHSKTQRNNIRMTVLPTATAAPRCLTTTTNSSSMQQTQYRERALALETRLRRVEADFAESSAARKTAEHEICTLKAQINSLTKSSNSKQSEIERLRGQHRDEVERRNEEMKEIERRWQGRVEEVERRNEGARKEVVKKEEVLGMLEKRYREQTKALEQLMVSFF